jgi:dihydrofolate synthase / folylpolyglutamate synthase
MDVALKSPRSVESETAQSVKPADYKQALDFLFARTTGGFKFGLERTVELLAHLGNPHRAYPSIHIAGTNGKGSSVATMSAVLTANGRRVATYTSPHLVDFRERMVVAGEPIPPGDVVEFIDRHMPAIEEIGASFFEATTAMAFDFFARAGAEIAVVEAGLGGRLDSTNVLEPLVAGVTSIGIDHTEYLGSTLEAIAGEKAGIFKPSAAAVIGERDARIRQLLAGRARELGATNIRVVADEMHLDHVIVDDSGTVCNVRWKGEELTLRTPLAGDHQAANLAFSLVALDAVDEIHSTSALASQLEGVRIPGRFQRVGRYIFDVAHNPAGTEVLVQTLTAVAPDAPLTVVLCVLGDKDWRAMIRALAGIASRFVLTMAPTAPASRAWDLGEATSFAVGLGLVAEMVPDFAAALQRATDVGGTVVITGSFHTVGDAMSLLQVSPFAG